MRYIVCIVVLMSEILNVCDAQDIHFSQYNASPLNLSPAFTGFFDGDYRVGAIYRRQWQAVPVPYSTISMFGDAKTYISKIKNISYGLLFNHDKAGDAMYTMNQIYIHIAHLYKLKKDSSFIMNVGLSLGYANNAFNYNRMTFDAQYDGLQFNAGLPTHENFYRTSLHYWDINIGAAFKYIINQKMYFTYTLSMMHINAPIVTYYANTSSRIDRKLSHYLMCQYPITPKISLLPEILLNIQGKYLEFLPGTQLSYLINNLDDINGRVGLYYRAKDAIILRIGLDYQHTFVGMSYDINISRFVPATNARGGFEIYLIHIIKKSHQYLSKKKPCPVFL